MIEKNEVIALAKRLLLAPETIEKDYVLSWLLWGIDLDKDFSRDWCFKGGTSLKKCFFEDHRFSEDLDFTVKNDLEISKDLLKKKFNVITENIYDETGIEFFEDNFKFEILPKITGKTSAQITIPYIGPLKRKRGNPSSSTTIKIDLTNDEIVVLAPRRKKIYHPYSDEPANGIWTNCYAFEEIICDIS